MNTRKRIIAVLASAKLTLVLLGIFAVAIAVATFIESASGTPAARALVYNARWFEVVIALFVVNVTVSLFVHFPYKMRQTGFIITHTGFVVVLVAAAITRYFGYEGTMAIREGADTNFMYSVEDHVHVALGSENVSFPVRLYKPGATSINRTITVDNDKLRVSVADYLPHAERRIVEAPGGAPVVVLAVSGIADEVVLSEGEHIEQGGISVRFVAQMPDAPAVDMGTNGDLVIEGGDGEKRIPVSASGVEATVDGWEYRITEFVPNFRVGRTPEPGDKMDNPAIRVTITSPDGTSNERILFAFHPDFDMGHSGEAAESTVPGIRYDYARHIYLALRDGQLMLRADFLLAVGNGKLAAGETSAIDPGTSIGAGTVNIIPRSALASGVERLVNVPESQAPPGVRIVVTDGAGNHGEAIVIRRRGAAHVDLGEKTAAVAYGPRRIDLPYRVHLDDFVLKTYPGSQNPASFESHVRVFDEARGVNGEPVRIYMNHPLGYRGFKHFQSSYDEDRLGTILSVNHDPGKWPTYIGYILVGLGFVVTLTRGIWYRKAVV